MHVQTTSQAPEILRKVRAEKVVKKLLSEFTGVGHIVFMDNLYTSVPLVVDLLDQMLCYGDCEKIKNWESSSCY